MPEHQPIPAELQARITSASAARADFHKAVDAYLDGAPRPDFQSWAFRMSSELYSLVYLLGDDSGGWISGGSSR